MKKTRSILATAFILVAAALGVAGAKRAPAPQQGGNANDNDAQQGKRPKVEVVFVIDTTGSMSGLIQGAKDKVWAIARHVASAKPRPDVKIGLVAYRDVGDAYVTKKFALTGDLDAVFENLMSFRADGGGDTPEHVYKGLHDAIHGMDWSKDSMKMVFLVGDAPPQTGYDDGADLATIMKEANRKEIRVHAIRCGGDGATKTAWNRIARLGRGTYASIASGGGVVAIATPHDAELAELGRKLNGTAIILGDEDERSRKEAKARGAASAPAAAAADRASYYATSGAGLDDADATAKPAEAIAAAPARALPAPMKSMTVEERKDYVAKKQAERAAIMKEMEATAAKRDGYLRKAGPAAKGEAAGFDAVVEQAITEQAKEHGLKY